MIVSFDDKMTEALFHGHREGYTRRFPPTLVRVAIRKLDALNAAQNLQDLRTPPGNRLEPLKGDLRDFYSIRVNDQWRIIFQWIDGNAHEVGVVDYH